MELDEPVFEQYLGEQMRSIDQTGSQNTTAAPALPEPSAAEPVDEPEATTETNALISTK